MNIFIFFVVFISFVVTIIFLFLIFFNRKSKLITDKFLSQVITLKPKVIKNIRIRYWITRNMRIMLSPNNYCDLYIFDSCLGIVRRQNFIFKVFFVPVLITPDIKQTKNI